MKKWLGWACKLGGAEFPAISKSGHTGLVMLMESQIWLQLVSSVGEGLEKGQWPLFTLMENTSVSPYIPLVSFKMLPQYWDSEGVSLHR